MRTTLRRVTGPDVAAVPSDSVPWRAVAVLGVGLLGMGTAVGGYGTLVSMLVERGVSPSTAGFGMTLFLLAQCVAVLPADHLSRRIAPQRVAAIGYVVGAVGAVVGGVVDPAALFVSRTLLGVGQGAAFVGGMKYVGHRTSGTTAAAAQGTLGSLFTLGLVAGLAGTPSLVAAVDPGLPMAGAAAFLVVGGVGAPTLARVETPAVPSVATYLEPLRSRVGVTLGLGNVATFGFLMVASTWYTDALGRAAGVPSTLVLGGFALATVAGRLSGGWMTRWVRRSVLVEWVFVGLTGLLALAAGAAWSGSAVLLALALVGTGVGFGLPFGPLFSLAFSELADDPGVTLVAMLVVGNLGALAYPWLVGRLFESTASYAASFTLMAVSVLLVAVAWHTTVRVVR